MNLRLKSELIQTISRYQTFSRYIFCAEKYKQIISLFESIHDFSSCGNWKFAIHSMVGKTRTFEKLVEPLMVEHLHKILIFLDINRRL